MQKKVLSEIALYYGDVVMPKDWDINRDKLQKDILHLGGLLSWKNKKLDVVQLIR